jgi:electron transfer flavoprotein alpha/beta subunit
MRVVVCCKGVPVNIDLESVDVVNGDIHFKKGDIYINEFDAYALEAAMYLTCMERKRLPCPLDPLGYKRCSIMRWPKE